MKRGISTDELRARFLAFFKRLGHTVVPSASLVPRHDPTILFTGAGMNQFKDQFMSRNVTFTRAVSAQKCLRTADLENVGRTPGHHTFFEMLGNFSFGDYFKKEAIRWAWDFLTEECSLPAERLWVSVYTDDDEACNIWLDEVGIAGNKIVKLGDKENFWPSEVKRNGPNGPCGPCSEVFYDRGANAGCGKEDCSPSCGCGRFVEVWNLVFTQFNRRPDGTLISLPKKNIDTGLGLERLAAVVQHKETNFETDIFIPIIEAVREELGACCGKDNKAHWQINAIADHIRAVAFCLLDGVRPSNEGRGFVVRKLIRKASQRARSLGVRSPFIYKVIPAVARSMKAYPDLARRQEDIAGVVLSEEVSLEDILNTVLPHAQDDMRLLKERGAREVPGNLIFKYYDEKGMPLDLIEEKAKLLHLRLDRDGFDNLLKEQKARSRKKSKVAGSIFFEKLSDVNLKTQFLYEKTEARAKVLGLLREGEAGGAAARTDSAGRGEKVHIAFDKTPFYGESGGQAGDRGEAIGRNLKVDIVDAKRYEDTIDHIGRIVTGVLNVGDEIELKIDTTRREAIGRNHTATHLLQSALKKVLGGHIRQYGSLVEADRLRFDFTHPAKLEADQLARIEEVVNGFIDMDLPVDTEISDLSQARASGAIALFGQKYKDKVMVRTIGGVSKELCGGTHVRKTGDIGAFKILSESSIASGVRRIEALTGPEVYRWLKFDIHKTLAEFRVSMENIKKAPAGPRETLRRIEDYLRPDLFDVEKMAEKPISDFRRSAIIRWTRDLRPHLIRTIEDLSRELKKMKKSTEGRRLNELINSIGSLLSRARHIDGVGIISEEIRGADMAVLRPLMDKIKKAAGSSVIILGARAGSKAYLICGVTEDLVDRGVDASKIVRRIAVLIEGSGGGRPDLAQAGGKRADMLKEALESGHNIVKEEIER